MDLSIFFETFSAAKVPKSPYSDWSGNSKFCACVCKCACADVCVCVRHIPMCKHCVGYIKLSCCGHEVIAISFQP